jgi:signal transduction histidine kinase
VNTRSRVERGRWIAGVVLGLAAIAESAARVEVTSLPYGVLLFVVALGTTVPVALRNPLLAALAVAAAGVISLTIFDTLSIAGIAAAVLAAFRCGVGASPVVAVALGVPYLVLALILQAPAVAGLLSALVPLAAGLGLARRVRREDAENRAAHEEIAESLVAHTARGERARIARELHDVVAHHISMIAVQAEHARVTTPALPTAAGQRLSAIGDTARAALTEMRRLLGVLREDARAEVAELRPQPGLRQLNDLLDEARDASGAGTRLILHGQPVTLDPGVELAAYRIVQEALTNSRRHAPGAAVDVELRYTDSALRLLIRDNGPGAGGPEMSTGHGLLGMRERAAAVGGELRVRTGTAGGFLVEASLPIQVEAES